MWLATAFGGRGVGGSGGLDNPRRRDRLRQRFALRRHLFRVGGDGLADAIGDFVAGRAKGDDAREIGKVGAPATIVGSFKDD